MSSVNYHQVGAIGTSIYAPFLFLCCVRCGMAIKDYIQDLKRFQELQKAGESNMNMIDSSLFQFKPIFHILLVIYVILDFSSFLSLWFSTGITYSSFILHECALFVNLCSFLTVLLYWSRTLPLLKLNQTPLLFGSIILSLNLVVLMISIITFARLGVSCSTEFCQNIFACEIAFDAFTLLVLSTWMFMFGIRLQFRMGSNSPIVSRINSFLGICMSLYFIRVLVAIYEIVSIYRSSNSSIEEVYSYKLGWFIISQWVPYIIPDMILLHFMRPRSARGIEWICNLRKGKQLDNLNDVKKSTIRDSDVTVEDFPTSSSSNIHNTSNSHNNDIKNYSSTFANRGTITSEVNGPVFGVARPMGKNFELTNTMSFASEMSYDDNDYMDNDYTPKNSTVEIEMT